jgi:hypothetical protein
MDDVEIKGSDRSPVKDPTHAPHDDKIHFVFEKDFQDRIKIRLWRLHLSTSEWNQWFAAKSATVQLASKIASIE